ncbi:ATP-binding protein [Saccharicrinis sp. FJH54]|uniref:AAA family ATPase n=1 Tax=Saccharicrinis sp. FJH54 TaxID=3344665 RepID=UPI0035D3E3EA
MNPFLIKGYKNQRYFCDRVDESEKLISAIINNQDITLYGYRRLGKSALIHHVFHRLGKEYVCVYADIWGTSSVDDFTKELANGIIKSKVFAKRDFSDKLQSFLKSIGASFSIGMDGLPSVDVVFNNRNRIFSNLEELFKFLNQLKVQIVFAIDEFQEIKKYDNQVPFEGKLRSLTQQSNNIIFIYSGSEQHLLNEIFTKYNMPFYQSTRMLSIGKIKKADYLEFILKHFRKAKKEVNPSIIEHILSISYLHTYYVQAMANFLFSLETLPETVNEFELQYREFILEKSVFYSELPELLTKQQFSVLKGVAKSGTVSSPNSAVFMEIAKIKSVSSMYRAFNALLDKQLVIKDNDTYRLYDVFLEHYLKYFL